MRAHRRRLSYREATNVNLSTRHRIAVLLTVFAFSAVQVTGQKRRLPSTLALTHVTVVDVTARSAGSALRRDQTVVIAGGRIIAVSTSAPRLPNTQTIDAAGKYLIPGLWDMHVHTGQKEIFFPLYLANGITGVRDMGGDQDRPTGTLSIRFDLLKEWRSEIEKGALLGPRLVIGGFMVDGPQPTWPGAIPVRDASDAHDAVIKLKQAGVDFIKVYSGVPRDAFFALARDAKASGMTFVGHLPFAIHPLEASDAGLHSIEHLGTGALLRAVSSKEQEVGRALAAASADPDRARVLQRSIRITMDAADSYDDTKAAQLFARFVKNDTWQVPTIVVRASAFAGRQAIRPELKYVPQAIKDDWAKSDYAPDRMAPDDAMAGRKAFFKQLDMVREMYRAGVGILAGSDSANPYIYPGLSLHEELQLFVTAGLTPLEALRTATIDPARFLKREDSLGSIDVGKSADLVLLDANPITDIRNTQRIAGIVVNGRYLSKSDLRRQLESAETAARASR
jgi:amidohydrolase family protein